MPMATPGGALVDLEQIEAVLEEALALEPPRFGPDERPPRKIALLEDHLLAVAQMNAKLMRARHWTREAAAAIADRWAKLEGWEVAIRSPRGRTTAADVQRAKVGVAPGLYDAGRKARRLGESLDEQIKRMEREERVMSRAYSFITGS